MGRFFTSLTFRIGIIIILVEILILTVAGVFYVNRFNQEIDDRLRYKAALPGELINRRLLSYVAIATDEQMMRDLVGEELLDKMIIRADGEIIVSQKPREQGMHITDLPRINPDWFDPDMTESLILEMPDGIVSVTPIRIFSEAEQATSFAYLKASTAQAEQEKRTITGLFLLGSLAAVFATSVVIILLFYSMISIRINKLLDVLRRVTGGDLKARVEGSIWSDQIGVLQDDVNVMAAQLQQTIETLEQQVSERTRGLETVVEISQQLAGILDLSNLLNQVVTLTKDTFDYYHVHIYMLEQDTLVLAEGYGEAGAEMKRQGHSIPLAASRSLVARAAREQRVVTVENTQEDPTWLPNPLLPDTRSEMAIPVVAGQEVVGILDVQSEKIGGLAAEDQTLLQALANQVAVAVRNARAFTQTQEALEEAQRLQRLYTGQAWESFSNIRATTDYEVRQSALIPLAQIVTPEALTALQHKQTVDLRIGGTGDGENAVVNAPVELNGLGDETPAQQPEPNFESALATPLKLGDEVIGVLGIRDNNSDRRWTEEEIALIETVSEQMSLAIENARLFEETGRRAGREKIIADVTRRIWASGELEQVMQTAVEQLGATLDASRVVIRLGTAEQLTQGPIMYQKQVEE